jgi:receptor-type tyrosine-protein phosphatase beta
VDVIVISSSSDPEPITAINATEINDTKITLAWDPPRGEYDAFEVQYINAEDNYVQNITSMNAITISDLKPHRNYTFTLVVRSGTESNYLRRSNPLSASFTTSESYPGRVDKFHPTDIQPSDISFEWSLPSQEQNGIIRKFSITYGLEVRAAASLLSFFYFITFSGYGTFNAPPLDH